MQYNEIPKEKRIQVVGNSIHQGLKKYFAGVDERVPYRKPKNKELSKTKKVYNGPILKEECKLRISLCMLKAGRAYPADMMVQRKSSMTTLMPYV